LALRKVALDYLERVDPNLGAALRMASVEVRRSVVVERHGNRDPEEPTDRRHTTHAAASGGGITDIAPAVVDERNSAGLLAMAVHGPTFSDPNFLSRFNAVGRAALRRLRALARPEEDRKAVNAVLS
jgi:hypothetical protein